MIPVFVSRWRRTHINPETAKIQIALENLDQTINKNNSSRTKINEFNPEAIKIQHILETRKTVDQNIDPCNNNNNNNNDYSNSVVTQPFQCGDAVMTRLVRSPKKQRDSRKLAVLGSGDQLVTHFGVLSHDDIVGQGSGVVMETSMGQPVVLYRPTLGEAVEVASQDKKRTSLQVGRI